MENKIGKKAELGMEGMDTSKKRKSVERVAITKEVSKRLDGWVLQLEEQAKGISATRADVMNFLLSSYPEELSAEDVRELNKRHFDEVKFTLWLARTLKQAKQNGENVRLEDLYKEHGRTQG